MKYTLYNFFNRFKSFFYLFLGLFIILGWFYRYQAVYPKPEALDVFFQAPNKKTELQGFIVSEPKVSENKTSFEFKPTYLLSEKEKKTLSGKSITTLYSDKLKLNYGDEIKLIGKIDLPPDAPNPYEFSYKNFLERKGIFTLISIYNEKTITVVEKEKIKDFKYYVIRNKNKLLKVFYDNMPKESAVFVSSLVFGSKSVAVPKYIQEEFTNTGLSHVLAASGMQVTLITGMGIFLITFFGINVILGVVLVSLVLLFYMALTDFPPSILRAGLISFFMLFAFIKKEQVDSMKILLAIVFLLLLLDPLMIHDIGFQFSVLATFALIYASKILSKKLTLIPYFLADTFAIIISAQLFVLPLQLYYFRQFSLLFLPANLIATLFVDLLTYFSIFTLTIGVIIPWAGFFFGKILYYMISLFLTIVEKLAGFSYSVLSVSTPSIYLVIIFYALIFFFIEYLKENEFKRSDFKKYNFSIPIIVFLVSSGFYSYEKISDYEKLKISFINVGQGDSTLIQTPEGKNILIDCGQYSEKEINGRKIIFNASERYIIPFLKHNGVNKIDVLILTHPDSDHIGGANSIIENFDVNEIWDSGQQDDSKMYSSLFESILKHNIPIKIVNKNDNYNEKNLSLKVINQINSNNLDEKSYNNNNAIVLKLTYKQKSFLFTADIEKEQEQSLLDNKADVTADILKVAHHGSKSSSTENFIIKVKPNTAVISVGKNNLYHHPSNSVLDTLNKNKIKIFRTDENGGIIVKTDGENINIETSIK